ncbi:MAG TPA: VOC family protein [Xanthobacteraceae bacterium]|nr:VOC family protein [Xanthobacteraceae bacterium]
MTGQTPTEDVARRLPRADEIFLDHVGHFVRNAQAAAGALERAGFFATPVSMQVDPQGQPTGTGNITAMFDRGYVEVLFKTADTALGREFDAAVSDYAGVHLLAFAVTDVERAHARLAASGFRMRPLAQFQRPVQTASGAGVAAFSVARVERGEMAEGRVQILAHRTPDTVWQTRWLAHRNGALALSDVAIAVADVAEAAGRFARFTGCRAVHTRFGQAVATDRGAVQLMSPEFFYELVPEVKIPRLPFMGAYAVIVRSVKLAAEVLQQGGLAVRRTGAVAAVPFPAELGVGAWLFAERAADLPWRG